MTYLSATPVDYTLIHAHLRLAAEKNDCIVLHYIHTLSGFLINFSV